ncbi:MAG: tripartite tricarboxylate transporter permease [Syntrophales bacterium]
MPHDYLLQAFSMVFTPTTLLFILLGVLLGELVGILPGISSPAAVALLLPLTYAIGPMAGLSMLAGVWFGSSYGGFITSILLNIPGEGDSVIATLDGYQLNKKGRASLALGLVAFGGFFAGTVSLIFLQFVGPNVAKVAIRFGAPEFFGLMIFGLSIVAWLSGKSVIKGILSTMLGLMIGCVGMYVVSGEARLTFGQIRLLDGIGFVPAVVGLFGLGEVLHTVGKQEEMVHIAPISMRGLLPSGRVEWKAAIGSAIRGTIIGSILGIVPGIGPTNTTFIGYAAEKALSKDPDKLGNGAIEGVTSPSAAAHSATISGMIPLLSLGIPASGTAALLLGAFMMHGMFPGPLLYRDHPEIVWGIIISLYVANVMLVIMNTVLIPFLVWIVAVSTPYLSPLIGILTLIGAYTLRNNVFDVWVALGFGLLGYVFRVASIPLAPLVIALILGPRAETALGQALVVSGGDPSVFFRRPVAAVFLVLAMIILLTPAISALVKRSRQRAAL